MLVYPAVDIAKGRCVRLLQGRPDDETVYYDEPLSAALRWQEMGAETLHVVDLDGALGRPGAGADAVRGILRGVRMPVQVAGGLRSTEAVEQMLEAGAARAVVGTRAVKDPTWARDLCRRLPGRIVIASGGVTSAHDIRLLGACGADAVVVGKAFYEELLSLADALEIASRYPSRLPAAPDDRWPALE